MSIDTARTAVQQILLPHFPQAAVSEWGSIFITRPEAPVLCKFTALENSGAVVVTIAAPVLLDFYPPADFFELVTVLQLQMPIGHLAVPVEKSSGLAMMEAEVTLFADGLQESQLLLAIDVVYQQALSLYADLQTLQPPIGGHRAT
jgi:hypothetical protein